MGDAAHATTPNMGQGASQAMEDAIVLVNCLENMILIKRLSVMINLELNIPQK